MFQADQASPRDLLLAGLVVLGALVALRELLGGLDLLRMASTTRQELSEVPLTTDPEADIEGGRNE